MTQNDTSNLNTNINGNYTVKQVDKQKLLGVFINEKILWSAHIIQIHRGQYLNKTLKGYLNYINVQLILSGTLTLILRRKICLMN